jgi:hypothetical protein
VAGAIGAKARTASALPTAVPSPTYVPTIQPVSPSLLATSAVLESQKPEESAHADGEEVGHAGPPLALTLALAAGCCVLLLVLGVLVLGIIVRRRPDGLEP